MRAFAAGSCQSASWRLGMGSGLVWLALSASPLAEGLQLARVTPLYAPSNPNQVMAVAGPGTHVDSGSFDPRLGLYGIDWNGRPALASAEALGKAWPVDFKAGQVTQAQAFGSRKAAFLVYLPSSFHAQARLPLMFAFSPVGDASRIVEVLRPAAEQMGWIVVGCNGPRDGRDNQFYATVREIMLEVRRRIPHQREREYLSGFSGGAMASYRLSRVYWDEFAGILAFGGWLGIYDKELAYPPRLAVALVNGRRDEGANQYEKQDRKILRKSGIRSQAFRFGGGHQYPPAQTVLEAMKWLEEDWQSSGQQRPRPGEEGRSRIGQLFETCQSNAHLNQCTAQGLDYLLHYPQSPGGDAARYLLAQAFARQPKSQAAFAAPDEFSKSAAVILFGMFQGLSEIDRPLAWTLLEAARQLDPNNARISARLALFVLQSIEPHIRNTERALELALEATRSQSKEWTGWFARGLSEGELGRIDDAGKSFRKAYQLAPNWAQRMCRQALESLQDKR